MSAAEELAWGRGLQLCPPPPGEPTTCTAAHRSRLCRKAASLQRQVLGHRQADSLPLSHLGRSLLYIFISKHFFLKLRS